MPAVACLGCSCAWERVGPPGCEGLAVRTVPATRAARGLGCACGCILSLPPGSACVATTCRGCAGVNEAFSAPGCIQGLQAAALIRLLSPRQWLPRAGQCVGASGLGSAARCQGCLVSRTRAHHDPVPCSSSGSARPQNDPWETVPLQAPSPLLHQEPGPQSCRAPRGTKTHLPKPDPSPLGSAQP